jgi:hypothetical protein
MSADLSALCERLAIGVDWLEAMAEHGDLAIDDVDRSMATAADLRAAIAAIRNAQAAPDADEVEVVARALLEQDEGPSDFRHEPWDAIPDSDREFWRDLARAALAALAPLRQAERERMRAEAIKEAADIALLAHLLPLDGGSPTEAERLVAKEAARRIRALAPAPAAEGDRSA